MKKVLLGLVMIVSATAIAQDIKIKKDKISIDGTEVAILDKEKLSYKILSLDNRPIFSIERKANTLLDGSLVYWSLLTDLSNNKVNGILDYGKDTGLSFQKAIVASVCNEKYRFISAAGIDEKGVLEYINNAPYTIQKDFDDADLKTIENLKKEQDILVQNKIRVNKNGDITQTRLVDKYPKSEIEDVLIGKISKQSVAYMPGFAPNLTYTVNSIYKKDEGSIKVTSWTRLVGNWYAAKTGYSNPVTGKNIKEQLITEDKKSFNVSEKLPDSVITQLNISEKTGDGDLLSKQIIAKLLSNGYEFEAMVK
jgi:hypothetical protein